MKKLFLSSIVLFFFSVAIIVFQMSCRKSASAQTANNPATLIVYVINKNFSTNNTIYTMNQDGTNQTVVNIDSSYKVQEVIPSTNSNSVYFTAYVGADSLNKPVNIYKCNLNGSKLQQVTNVPSGYTAQP